MNEIYRVTRKQENSRMCIICGLENKLGLQVPFYELDSGELAAIFTPLEQHQSYPGIMHGGIVSAILDEIIGRAMMFRDQNIWGVTTEIKIQYLKPVPLDTESRAIGRITGFDERFFEGTGEIILSNGDIAARGSARYMKLPLSRITGMDSDFLGWKVTPSSHDPVTIEY